MSLHHGVIHFLDIDLYFGLLVMWVGGLLVVWAGEKIYIIPEVIIVLYMSEVLN